MRAAGLIVASCVSGVIFLFAALTVCSTGVRADCMDIDGSGALDAVDVQLVINGALGLPVDYVCDVDVSGEINAVDVQKVINAVLGVSVPAVDLSADPPDVPPDYPVVFSSAVTGLCEAGATCTWDYGDGRFEEGLFTGLHAYAEEGDYTVTLTVSDGLSEATGQVTVHVAAAGGTSKTIGPEGGSVSLGMMTVDVPAGLLSETVPFALSPFPAMKTGSGKALDPARFQPIGPAYWFDTPLRSAAPLSVAFSYDPAEIPDGFSPENLGVIRRAAGWAESPGEDSGPDPRFAVCYPVLPATVNAKANVAAFETSMGGEFQLVAMAEPLGVVEFQGPAPEKGAGIFKLTYKQHPDLAEYEDAVVAGLTQGFDRYVNGYGFDAPDGTIHVEIDQISGGTLGFVPLDRPTTIILNFALTDLNQIAKTAAHEYFHVIQLHHSNPASVNTFVMKDLWFIEGTACWAMDEVFDDIANRYHAPTASRFRVSLDQDANVPQTYQAVAFWKYVEAKAAGGSIIKATLEQQRLMTSALSLAGNVIMNADAVQLGDSFRAVYPNVPFLSFFRSALFHKDFEEDETRPGDLWDAPRLGPPNQLPQGLPAAGKTHTLRKEQPGDSEDNKLTVPFSLDEHLTADVFVVKNTPGDAAVEGTLHVDFTPNATVGYEAAVIAYKGTTVVGEAVAVGFGKQDTTTAKVSFDAETVVAIIVVDPNWEETPGAGMSECDVWVAGEEDPCGDLEGPFVDVDTVEALLEVLDTPPVGSTIRLAPGTYYLSAREYETDGEPQLLTVDAYLKLDGVTLAGDPEAKPVIVMTGDPANCGIFVEGASAIRNLELRGDNASVWVSNAPSFTMCGVVIETQEWWAVCLEAWDDTSMEYTISHCELTALGTERWDGIDISTYAGQAGACAPRLRLILEENTIRNWYTGVFYWGDSDSCVRNVTVVTDCSGFINCTEKVIEAIDGTKVEHCP